MHAFLGAYMYVFVRLCVYVRDNANARQHMQVSTLFSPTTTAAIAHRHTTTYMQVYTEIAHKAAVEVRISHARAHRPLT